MTPPPVPRRRGRVHSPRRGTPLEIVYCDRCGRIIAPSEVSGRRVIATSDGLICPECVKTMPDRERASPRATPRPALRATPSPSRRTPVARQSRRQSTRRASVVSSSAPANRVLHVLAVAGVIFGIGAGAAASLLVLGKDKKAAVATPVFEQSEGPVAADDATGHAPPKALEEPMMSEPTAQAARAPAPRGWDAPAQAVAPEAPASAPAKERAPASEVAPRNEPAVAAIAPPAAALLKKPESAEPAPTPVRAAQRTGDVKGDVADAAPVKATAGNLVVNSGFEKKSVRGSFAANWVKHQWGDRGANYSARRDRTNPRSGEFAVVVRAFTAGCRPGALTSIRLEKGTYELRYWACADIDEKAMVLARHGDAELAPHSVSDEWQQFRERFEVTDERLRVSIGVCTTTLKARVWFDDVEVIRVR